MKKSYNDIKEQEKRILLLCQERGRYCDNAKKRVDTQRIAQITRRTLTQHGFPIFGNFDRGEKRPYIVQNSEKPKEVEAPAILQVNKQKKTPTEIATERVTFQDWMNESAENRKKIQDTCRHAFVNKMYAELLTDMEICKLEGWDILEFPRMLKQALQVCFPKPVQLKLFDNENGRTGAGA